MITINKLFLFIALTVLGVSLLATPKTANATFNPKATICHNGNTIEVALSALPAHLLHGDKLGACVVASPTPTPTTEPTATPSATPTSTPEATEEPCVSGDYVITKDIPDGWPTKPCDPEPTPAPTEQPTLPFSQPGGNTAPELPQCPSIEQWIPTVFYHGSTFDKDGNSVFHYTWSTVENNHHTYKVEYGFTPDFLPYNVIVHEEKADIRMFGGHTNWMRVALYKEPGCHGKWSAVVN